MRKEGRKEGRNKGRQAGSQRKTEKKAETSRLKRLHMNSNGLSSFNTNADSGRSIKKYMGCKQVEMDTGRTADMTSDKGYEEHW